MEGKGREGRWEMGNAGKTDGAGFGIEIGCVGRDGGERRADSDSGKID